MASIVLSSVGTSIGNALLPGIGGRVLGAAGRKLGDPLDEAIGWSDGADSPKDGARLENFKVQDSRYGLSIPVAFGCARVAGNIIWTSGLIETSHESEVSGGKGGGTFGGGSSRTTYTYSLHAAIALCEGPIGGLRTIWADSKIIYQDGAWKDGVVSSASFYLGGEGQEVDPLMESMIGAGDVPAYQGLAYVVLESLQLGNFGNRLPNLTFEITPVGDAAAPKLAGYANPSCLVSGTAVRGGSVAPIVIEAGSLQARRVLLGGYTGDGATASFVALEQDVTEDVPVETSRQISAVFIGDSLGGQSVALAPDRRFAAFGLQNNDAGKSFAVALYDCAMRSFGAVSIVGMGGAEDKQIAWLDSVHFLVYDKSGDKRGVRLFMRSGADVQYLGFYDIWGAGSATTRYPLGYAHFLPVSGGLLCLAGNASPKPSALYGCLASWKNGKLSVEAPYTIASGLVTGSGGNQQIFALRTGGQEWTFVYGTNIDTRLMSFVPTATGAQIVRSWTTFNHVPFSMVTAMAPVCMGDHLYLVMRSSYSATLGLADIVLGSSGFEAGREAVVVDGTYNAPQHIMAAKAGGGRLLVAGCSAAGQLYFDGLIATGNDSCDLGDIAGQLLKRAGYTAQDFDVSALSGVKTGGFVLSDSDTLMSALQWVQAFEPFDLIERDGLLAVQKRGQVEALSIEEKWIGAQEDSEKDYQPALEVIRLRETSLPVEVTLDTIEAARDYEIGTQRARRMIAKGGARRIKLALPFVCAAREAKRIAERILYRLWGERTHFAFALPASFGWIEVGDVLNLKGQKMRVTLASRRGGVIEIEAVSAVADTLESKAQAQSGMANVIDADSDASSRLYLMDLPALRAGDDGAGFYAAVSGGAAWKGAQLWRSADGVNFARLASFDTPAVAGNVVQVPNVKRSYYKDIESVLKVQLYQGSLASCAAEALLNGGNVAFCGGEILQFEKAVLVGPMLYELSGLLRGRMGTESAIATHMAGEDFVLLDGQAVQFIPCALQDRDKVMHYRAVSNGGTIGFAQDLAAAATLRPLRPLAPVHVSASRSAGTGSDCTFSWKRRARINGGWADYVDVPLDEGQELYDVEIMNGASVVRSFTDIGATQLVYTAAQQSVDWGGSVPDCFSVRIYQKSAHYGRGDGASAVV